MPWRDILNYTSIQLTHTNLSLISPNRDSNEYHLQPDYQSACRSNHSTETALIKLVDSILWSMEQRKVTALVAMDLSAAFDTVDHEILLKYCTKALASQTLH